MDQRVAVPRWVQLVMLPLAILGLWAVLEAAGRVLLLFIIAALVALILNPFVSLLRRAGVPRGIAVLIVMLCVVASIVAIGFLLANPVADQVDAFRDNVPDIVDDANATLADVQRWLDENGINVQIAEEGQTALGTLGQNLSEGSGELVSFTQDALRTLVEASLALILVIVISVYMLLYGERIGAGVRSLVHSIDADDYPLRIQRAVFGYVRGQILFSLIMGTSAGLMLWVLGSLGIFPDGKTYALFFGAWYGFAELIPYIGPAIGAGPAGADRAVQRRAARRAVADDRVHRPAADRGSHRRAERVRAGAADQPAPGDLRAAAGRADLWLHRRLHRTAAGGDGARERRLLPPPLPLRAVGPAVGDRRRAGRAAAPLPGVRRAVPGAGDRVPGLRHRAGGPDAEAAATSSAPG